MKELTNIFLKIIFNSAMLQKHVIFFFRVSISAGFDVRKLAKKKKEYLNCWAEITMALVAFFLKENQGVKINA